MLSLEWAHSSNFEAWGASVLNVDCEDSTIYVGQVTNDLDYHGLFALAGLTFRTSALTIYPRSPVRPSSPVHQVLGDLRSRQNVMKTRSGGFSPFGQLK